MNRITEKYFTSSFAWTSVISVEMLESSNYELNDKRSIKDVCDIRDMKHLLIDNLGIWSDEAHKKAKKSQTKESTSITQLDKHVDIKD